MAFCSVLQWNCRGLLKNLDDVKELLWEHAPLAVCLQETHLSSKHTDFLPQYITYRKDRQNTNQPSGGVAIILQRSTTAKEVKLRTELEAVAVRVIWLQRLITICSIYIPPDKRLQKSEFENLMDQLPEPYIIAGDYNAHHPLWGCENYDSRGRMIEKLLVSTGACILNKKKPTYFSPTHKTSSSVDLALCTATLFPLLDWHVLDDPYGSDHFPIVLKEKVVSTHGQNSVPRWRMGSADWKKFRQLTCLPRDYLDSLDIDSALSFIEKHIIEAASECIPQSSGNPKRKPIPWWNEDCQSARKKQNAAWRLFRNSPTTENYINFKRIKSQSRRVRRIAKSESWEKYIEGINSYTDQNKVWNRIRKLQGQQTCPRPLVDNAGGTLEDQADALGAYFESVSSAAHYSAKFLKLKRREEKLQLHRKSPPSEAYNAEFSIAEFEACLNTLGKAAPGPDNIHYEMIKNLHPETQLALLSLFNRIWNNGYIPPRLKEAIVVPVLKEGKDPAVASSYRPIALTSCLCKVFEKMINRRLMHFLEANRLLDPFQCGFREQKSTLDQLVRLESQIRYAFAHKQYFLSVFFDLEKAYDTTWRFGILRDLCALGIQGNMLKTIESYLSDRTFRVRIGSTLSKPFTQETGVPQGGVLSCTLFIVKMNSLRTVLPPTMFYSVYVDDVQIGFKSCNLSFCERQIQLSVNKLSKWADENGFKFNPSKSACVLFSKKRGIAPAPEIYLNGQLLPVKTEHKFLGLIFDSRLSFTPHLKHLKLKCLKAMNVLKILAHMKWGTDKKCLLHLYKSLVLSRLDYGCVVYGSASSTALKMLDPIHNLGIRLATGAFRTSPVLSLYAESGCWSLEYQRTFIGIIYALKVTSQPEHPCDSLIRDNSRMLLFSNRPSLAQPFPLLINSISTKLSISFDDTLKMTPDECVAPWDTSIISCDTSFRQVDRKGSLLEVKQHFAYLQDKYKAAQFFTDASKTKSAVACAVVGQHLSIAKTMHKNTTIFTAEAHGVYLAVDHIITSKTQKSVIFTDSLSVVTALSTGKGTKNPTFTALLKALYKAHQLNLEIIVCWVPGHCGIAGNEEADQAAARAAERTSIDITQVPYLDMKPAVKHILLQLWQKEWDGEVNNKLHLVQPIIGRSAAREKNRAFEVWRCRLRIGHTHGTHSYLLTGDQPPNCARCGEGLSVLHVLVECSAMEPERRRYFPEMYRKNMPRHIAMFLSDCPVFEFSRVLEYLDDIGFLKQVCFRK